MQQIFKQSIIHSNQVNNTVLMNNMNNNSGSLKNAASESDSSSKTHLAQQNRIQFPWKLHEMLENSEKEQYDDIVCWLPDGLAFMVKDSEQFMEKIMPRYFKQTKFKSFQRQLYIYGFSKILKGPNKGAYRHIEFSRQNKLACQKMTPNKSKKLEQATQSLLCQYNRILPSNAQGQQPQVQSTTSNNFAIDATASFTAIDMAKEMNSMPWMSFDIEQKNEGLEDAFEPVPLSDCGKIFGNIGDNNSNNNSTQQGFMAAQLSPSIMNFDDSFSSDDGSFNSTVWAIREQANTGINQMMQQDGIMIDGFDHLPLMPERHDDLQGRAVNEAKTDFSSSLEPRPIEKMIQESKGQQDQLFDLLNSIEDLVTSV